MPRPLAQSLSLPLLQPPGQQPSPSLQEVIGLFEQDPEQISAVHASPSLQSDEVAQLATQAKSEPLQSSSTPFPQTSALPGLMELLASLQSTPELMQAEEIVAPYPS